MVLGHDPEAGDIFCPEVLCDQCGRQIADGAHGLYLWQVSESGRPADGSIRFVHKRECDDAFCDAHGGKAVWGCIELKHFPIFLARNLKPPKRGTRR